MPAAHLSTTDALIAAAREHVARFWGPSRQPRSIIIHIDGVADAIVVPCPPPCPVAASNGLSSTFTPSPYQERIMDALAGKALTADALAEKVGDRRRLFRPGGIKELMDQEWVKNHPRHGYFLPDDPPQEIREENS